VKLGTVARIAAMKNPRNSTWVGAPYTTRNTRPPGMVTRFISRSARGRSGKSMTPYCDPAMSKRSSSSSSA
jgi:hypothetical protein